MSQDKFTQPDWEAETVNQTVNNYSQPDLSRLSIEEKVDLIVRKIIGSPWFNEPGIMPTLKRMMEAQEIAVRERRILFILFATLALFFAYLFLDIYLF